MEMFIIAAIAGIGVGILSGLLGIGGGTIMVPLFRLVFGMDAIVAVATSLFTIVPTSISGMSKHVRSKTSVVKIGIVCGLFGACFSPLGVLLAHGSPAWLIMAVAAVIIAYSAATMLSKALKNPRPNNASAPVQSNSPKKSASRSVEAKSKAEEGDGKSIEIFRFSLKTFITTALIGVFAGFMSGYVGVGGGFIMVPLFVSLLGVPMRLASGTSLTAVCILAIPGVVEQALLGNINFAVGIAMAIGSIPGAVIGASLVRRIPERTLRIIFACFLLAIAVILVLNEVGALA